jgi:hypothetical protein
MLFERPQSQVKRSDVRSNLQNPVFHTRKKLLSCQPQMHMFYLIFFTLFKFQRTECRKNVVAKTTKKEKHYNVFQLISLHLSFSHSLTPSLLKT